MIIYIYIFMERFEVRWWFAVIVSEEHHYQDRKRKAHSEGWHREEWRDRSSDMVDTPNV